MAGTVSAGRIRGVECQGHERLVTCREELQGVELWEWGEEDLINRKAVLDKFVAYPEVFTVDGDKYHVGGLQNVGKVNLSGETAWSCRTVKGAVGSQHSDGVWVGYITRMALFCKVETENRKYEGFDSNTRNILFLANKESVVVPGRSCI